MTIDRGLVEEFVSTHVVTVGGKVFRYMMWRDVLVPLAFVRGSYQLVCDRASRLSHVQQLERLLGAEPDVSRDKRSARRDTRPVHVLPEGDMRELLYFPRWAEIVFYARRRSPHQQKELKGAFALWRSPPVQANGDTPPVQTNGGAPSITHN